MYYTYNDYINNNDIAIESFLSKALSKLQTLFAKLILKIDKMVKRMKDNKLKKILTNLLSRAKRGLSRCKSLNEHNPELVRELQEEYNEINEEVQEVVKEGMITPGIEEKIAKKDIKGLRGAIGTMYYINWLASISDIDAVIKYVESKGIKLKDDHLVGDPPISTQKKTFTDDDLAEAVFELKRNFCEERLKDVKTIHRFLYPEK